MSFTFTGTTNVKILWDPSSNGAIIKYGNGSPPNIPISTSGYGSIVSYTPDDETITWKSPNAGTIPQFLNSQSLNSLLNNINLNPNLQNSTINRSVLFSITNGEQITEDTGLQNINLFILDTNNSNVLSNVNLVTNNPGTANSDGAGSIQYCNSGLVPACPNYTYQYPTYRSGFLDKITEIRVSPWNMCQYITCSNHNVVNFGMTAEMTITISIQCNTLDNINNNPFCLTYCNDNDTNRNLCKTNLAAICFTTTTTPDIVLTSNVGCQNFFKGYYDNLGPNDPDLEFDITQYCSTKYNNIGFQGLFNGTASEFDKNLCACHMYQPFYDEFEDSLLKLYPNFVSYIKLSGINERCLVSQCASSDFPSAKIKDGTSFRCKIPSCISVVDFNNGGTINGKVTINSDQRCENIANGTTGSSGGGGGNKPTPPTQKPWIERNWYWLALGAFILIIIIVIIIVLVNSRKKPVMQI